MISVVIPVYNAEKYLKKSLESILRQTYPEWEMILIDNGSEDRSLEICQEYSEKEERIRVLHQFRNEGVSVARNLGIEKATGDYITFLDADDWVEEDYLEQLLKTAEDSKADMLMCGYQKVYGRNREIEETRTEKETQEFTIKTYNRKDYISTCLLNGYTHCWGVLYKLSLLEGIRFPSGVSIGEDVLFLIDTVLQAEKMAVTQYDGYRYYINENGAMNRKFTPSYMDQILCWQKAKEKLTEQYPEVTDKINSILVVSAMLVVGKLSALSKDELSSFEKELKECKNVIQKYCDRKQVLNLLPSGYALKVKIFKISPVLYMKMYGAWKK